MSDQNIQTATAERMPAKDAAKYLGVKDQTLAAWRCTGRYGLRFVRVGRIVQYHKQDLDNWLNARSGTNSRQIAAAV